MADIRLRIPPGELDKFEEFLKIETADLTTLISNLNELPPLASEADVTAQLESLGNTPSSATAMTRLMLTLASIRLSTDTTLSEVMTELRKDLSRQSPPWWNSETWDQSAELVVRLLNLENSAFLIAKAGSITNQGSNLVIRSRVFTDTRWVFSDEADKIMGSVTRHELVLTTVDGTGNDKVSVYVMDDSDLKKLADQVNRALDKSQRVSELTSKSDALNIKP